MTIVPTVLTSGGNAADQSSYNTASITPPANTLILLFVSNALGVLNTPTVTGCNMTWTQVITAEPANTRLTVFRGVGSAPTTGALTIDFAGQTQNNCRWVAVQLAGADTGGANGANGVVQSGSAAGNGSTASISLSAIAKADNITIGGLSMNTGSGITVGSGYTELVNVSGIEGNTEVEWRLGTNNVVSWTYTGANNDLGVALEIKAAVNNSLLMGDI